MFGEYLTFGRRPWRLIRIWILQIVIVFSEVQLFGEVHPWISSHFHEPFVPWGYLLATLVSIVALIKIIERMGQLTFAPWSRSPRYLAISTLGYLGLGFVAVGTVWVLPAPDLEPNLGGGVTLVELALGGMATGVLADLLALGFYAQFDATGFPTQEEIDKAVEEWLDSLDWAGMEEGSWGKEQRYQAFEDRSKTLASVLENAVTEDGQRLRDDFDGWLAWFQERDRLSQEAVIRGSVENRRLERGRDRLIDMKQRLERINDQ